jgi:hypothetical protein
MLVVFHQAAGLFDDANETTLNMVMLSKVRYSLFFVHVDSVWINIFSHVIHQCVPQSRELFVIIVLYEYGLL